MAGDSQNRPMGWDEDAEREALRAWLETVPAADRTPWAVFCLGASRYKLVADQAKRDQQRRIKELHDEVQHVRLKMEWLEPDASRWLDESVRYRARIYELERALTQAGIPIPPLEAWMTEAVDELPRRNPPDIR